MSYIGSTPTTQSFIAGTDYFNGTGSAVSFTLSRAVNSVNDIEVIVNNVEQIPSGYSVSGTTLTFSAAPSAGTSNVYVRYLSTTNLSLAIPAGTSATFNTITATTVNTTALTTTNGASIQGLTVGKGAGAVASNTTVGVSALAAVTTGANNSASGYFAGKAITDGALNTAFGSNALLTLIGNNANSAFGANAGKSTTAGNNTFVGSSAGFTNSTGGSNVSLGAEALYSNTTASNNTAVGYQAMYSNTTGTGNTAIGSEALYANLVGVSNTAIGYRALLNYASSTNGNNTALGHQTGLGLTTGLSNTFLGAQAGTNNTTGSGNTFVGREGGYFCTTGSGNTVLNPRTGTDSYSPVFALTTENNRMILGSTAVTNAYIQVAWTVVSDLRDKVVLGNVPLGLDFVRKLKPIKYQFKETREGNTPTGAVKYGFGAQDVLAEEGDAPVIIDTEVADKLKITDSHMMPVFANAIKEMADMIDQLKAEIALLKRATP